MQQLILIKLFNQTKSISDVDVELYVDVCRTVQKQYHT